MRRLIAMLTVFVLVLGGCGGDSSGADDDNTAEPQTTQAASPDAGSTDSPATTAIPVEGNGGIGNDDSASEGSGPSTATVTLGDETYSFSTEGAIVAQCLTDLFGIFSVQLPMADGGDGSVAIIALREGTDPAEVGEVNSISVAVGDDDWIADEDDSLFEQDNALEPGMGQVDSVEIDGRTVRGTATFFRQNSVFTGEVETLTGTFEATCGEERTS